MNISNILNQLLWCCFAVVLLIFSLGLSWQVNKAVNFTYGIWYQTLEINRVIAINVPKNNQGKQDFPVEDVDLHNKLFSNIVDAIHQKGNGLAEISYENSRGIVKGFLTKSEIQHLEDVANLLDGVMSIWQVNGLIFLVFILFYCRKPTSVKKEISYKQANTLLPMNTMPSTKQKLISIATVIVITILFLAAWGFTAIFYYLHTVIFPSDHQWFFYYQESLMSTIMKAPDIFAAIAGQLLFLALLLCLIIDRGVQHVQSRNRKAKSNAR